MLHSDLPSPGDTPDQSPAGGRRAEPPPAHKAAVLMGLGDLVGRGALMGLESESWDIESESWNNEGPGEEHQRGERRPPEGGGGVIRRSWGGSRS